MECQLCGHTKTHKHGKMPNGHQRYFCPQCKQTLPRALTRSTTIDISVHSRLPSATSHSEGTSLRGINRISGLAYNTVVSIIRSSSSRALLVHNDQVTGVETEEVSSDEMGSFGQKTKAMPI